MPNIPTHIAIIPDGNRRWAKEQGLPTFEGHRRGFEQIIKVGKKARELGIKILSVWAFSTENWDRSEKEVAYLMRLYQIMIDKNLQEALKNQIRIIHLGRKDRIAPILRENIIDAEQKTQKFEKYYLNIALDYGGRDEVLRAIKKVESGKLKVESLDENNFNQFLDTKNLPYPEVDLLIRTGGEQRTSGFMIWQAAYAEYIFYPKYLPDFTPDDFAECIREYQTRQRRFGK